MKLPEYTHIGIYAVIRVEYGISPETEFITFFFLPDNVCLL